MADQTPNVCGDPSSVAKLGGASGQTGSELDKLTAEVNSDVKATVQAQQFRAKNNLYLRPDLAVQACDPNQPDAQAVVAVGQNQVNTARQIAEMARQQIRAANQTLEDMAGQTINDVATIILNSGGRGRLGRRGGPRPKKGPTMPRQRPTGESELLYGPEGKIRLPKEGTGTWSGTPGDSVWTPNNSYNYGLHPGQSIRWHEGVPDLSEHAVEPRAMLDRGPANLEGLPLTGNRDADNLLGDKALAERFHMTPDQVNQWRKDNDYIFHHYSDHELQLVPGRIHRPLAHQGSASEISP